MTVTELVKREYLKLLSAQEEYGSNCIDRPQDFSGDDKPSAEKAKELCADCPLAGLMNPCNNYARAAVLIHQIYGVYDGVWYDSHGDTEEGWDEEVEMVAALGINEPTEGDESE